MNTTIKVLSMFDCDSLDENVGRFLHKYNPMWRQTVHGCMILYLLRDMFKFNISYVSENPIWNVTVIGDVSNVSYDAKSDVDVYLRSMSLSLELMEELYPVHATNTWRFGFLLSRSDSKFFTTFYSKPFSRPVWNCLYGAAFMFSIFFYLLKKWEFRILGGWECSFPYEMLMIIGAYCQHVPPIDPKLPSRRVAYFVFLVFSYTVYTFYTSNLLSNLVNDKTHDIDLKTLANSSYECVIVNYMMLAISKQSRLYNRNYSTIIDKLLKLRSVSVTNGLKAVKNGKVALLSDYNTIYPHIKKNFNNEEICNLVSIDLFSSIKKYLFTSKDFQYKEQFKIGLLRIQEAGLLNRQNTTIFTAPHCTQSHLVQIQLKQISTPLATLMGTYVISLLILVAERIHYKKNKVWPYVE